MIPAKPASEASRSPSLRGEAGYKTNISHTLSKKSVDDDDDDDDDDDKQPYHLLMEHSNMLRLKHIGRFKSGKWAVVVCVTFRELRNFFAV